MNKTVVPQPGLAHDDEGGGAEGAVGVHRSGVAARLAGLPVETLRVWERRYGVSAVQRSAHGQRLYSDAQVRRLGLIKQLVDHGHPIGALARLPLTQLRHMAEGETGTQAQQAAPARPIRVALVGRALAQRLAGGAREALALDVLSVCPALDQTTPALRADGAELLLIEVAELVDATLPLIDAARQVATPKGCVAVLVLYRFCASASARRLRAQGCMVARAPADLAEIVLLCQVAVGRHAARAAVPPTAPAVATASAAAPARRLDEPALAALIAAANGVACECPRHLAEILLTLGSFERYSAQCGARSPADAVLHHELGQAAGHARALLETALERLAQAEGLPLPSFTSLTGSPHVN